MRICDVVNLTFLITHKLVHEQNVCILCEIYTLCQGTCYTFFNYCTLYNQYVNHMLNPTLQVVSILVRKTMSHNKYDTSYDEKYLLIG